MIMVIIILIDNHIDTHDIVIVIINVNIEYQYAYGYTYSEYEYQYSEYYKHINIIILNRMTSIMI